MVRAQTQAEALACDSEPRSFMNERLHCANRPAWIDAGQLLPLLEDVSATVDVDTKRDRRRHRRRRRRR